MTVWTGSIPTFGAMQAPTATEMASVTGALAALSEAWTSYTPSWTAPSVNPAIGNGSITGKYIQINKLVIATADITMGSTTTYGTGAWRVSLPVTALELGFHVGVALVFDSGTDNQRRAGATYLGATTYVNFAADGLVAAAVPITWATGDVLRFTIIYEAA